MALKTRTAVVIEKAIAYLKKGFSVIPVKGPHYAKGKTQEERYDDAKKPLIAWQAYQQKQATEDEIKAWGREWPGMNIAIVTGPRSNLAVIDVDDIKIADPILADLLPDSLLIPTSQTPSGGRHYFFEMPNKELGNGVKVFPGCDLRANGGYVLAPPSVNGNGQDYAWLEGLSIFKVAPPPFPDALLARLQKRASDNKNNIYKGGHNPDSGLTFTKGNRDDNLFHVSNMLKKGGASDAEALQILIRLASTCNPPFPPNELPAKVLSAKKRLQQREFNLTQEVERYISGSEKAFSVRDVLEAVMNSLDISESISSVRNRYKNNIRQAIHYFKNKKKLIKPYGDKEGWYVRVDDHADDIDWWNASTESLDIRYPLGINEYYLTFPRTIGVLAGESNAGKTAFFLNLALLCADRFKVTYFSSEMGDIELKTRLSKFDAPLSVWKKIKFKERSANFADIIDPDGFTIIDFLEITKDFYEIAGYIKEIYDRLNKGICILGIQKNKGTDYGRGGQLGLEKARLYLAMEPGKIKIVKAKAWAKEGVNPNGLQNEFKLVQGCKFVNVSGWHRAGEI